MSWLNVCRKRQLVEDSEDEDNAQEKGNSSSSGEENPGTESGSDFSGGGSESSEDMASDEADSEEEETPVKKPKQVRLLKLLMDQIHLLVGHRGSQRIGYGSSVAGLEREEQELKAPPMEPKQATDFMSTASHDLSSGQNA